MVERGRKRGERAEKKKEKVSKLQVAGRFRKFLPESFSGVLDTRRLSRVSMDKGGKRKRRIETDSSSFRNKALLLLVLLTL